MRRLIGLSSTSRNSTAGGAADFGARGNESENGNTVGTLGAGDLLGGLGLDSGTASGSKEGVRTGGKYEAGCLAMESEIEGLNHPTLRFDEGVARGSVCMEDDADECGDVDFRTLRFEPAVESIHQYLGKLSRTSAM